MLPYGLIVLAASVGLAIVYVCVSQASIWSKVVVAGLMVFSFVWRYGMWVQVAVGIFLSLYFIYLKSRSDHG